MVPVTSAGATARGHAQQHARALAGVLVVSAVGVASTAAFQLLVIRGLGPSVYGLLASFLALINVASIGSAALRNSVAVATAEARRRPVRRGPRLDGSTIEALVLGAICTVGVLVASPLLGSGEVSPLALVFAALTVGPYFLFARAQGLLQGAGRARAVVLWSTGAQVLQLGLSVVALALGWSAVGVLGALLLTSVLGTVGAAAQARRGALGTGPRAFSADTVVVLLLTVVFTWVTSMDVVLVRGGSPADVAGAYAAAVTVIKTILIVPSTLSLYLLPRFVARRDDSSMTRLGVAVTLGITLVASLVMVGLVTWLGDVVAAIFGDGYAQTAELLPLLAVAWIPWAMAQGLLIRLTAASTRVGVGALLVLALVQWFGGKAALPSVETFIVFNGAVGVAVLVAFLAAHLHLSRRVPGGGPQGTAGYAHAPTAPGPDADRHGEEDGTP